MYTRDLRGREYNRADLESRMSTAGVGDLEWTHHPPDPEETRIGLVETIHDLSQGRQIGCLVSLGVKTGKVRYQ